MAKESVVILHGWSDKSKSFEPLRDFLGGVKDADEKPVFDVKEIWLSDYISMSDDVRVEDVARRMQVEIERLLNEKRLTNPFDMIVHSTGGLVVREWLATCYPDGAAVESGKPCPLKRLVMLAPANFGSKLAAVGKSMVGRLTKGLGNGLETGEHILKALELASPYQWKLAKRDLLRKPGDPDTGTPFGKDKVWPFVLIGTRAYDKGLRQVINEHGSDGTVRVPAGNLNCVGMTIDFTRTDPKSGASPWIRPWALRLPTPAPLAVLPERDHGEIIHPETSGHAVKPYGDELGRRLVQALCCDSFERYVEIEAEWRRISNETAMLGLTAKDKVEAWVDAEDTKVTVRTIKDVFGKEDDDAEPEHFHRYLQLNVHVCDDDGNDVDDYFLEFRAPKGDKREKGATEGDAADPRSLVRFHKEVLEGVHNNSRSAAYRCLYIDHTDLIRRYYEIAEALTVTLTATPPGRNIKYFDARDDDASGEVTIHAEDTNERNALRARLFRNQTHFVEVIIPRRGVDEVFEFRV